MGEVSFSLDADQEAFVSERLAEGTYPDAAAYFSELVRRDQEHQHKAAELRDMLDKAAASGTGARTPRQIMADVRAELKADGRL